jgi:hypothetical protein
MTAPARRTGDPEAGAVVEYVRWQGAASPPWRDDAAGRGFAEAQPRLQLAVVVYGRKGPSRRLAATCGRSDHQIDGDRVIPPFQRCPRSRLDRGSSRHGGLPLSTVAKVGIKTIAWRPPTNSAAGDPRAIVMMHSVYEIRVTLSTKKSLLSGREGWLRCQRYAVRPAATSPHRYFIHRPPITWTWRDLRI